MGKSCSWCGKPIGTLELSCEWMAINSKEYYICKDCCQKISAYKKGNASLDEIITENTAPELLEYYNVPLSTENAKKVYKNNQEKLDRRQTDPLYDDIHQIAGDLRFIKNYLIICIIVGVLWGIISAVILF